MCLTQGTGPHSTSRGFTLIEILVVVVIISISIGFVVINIAGSSDEDRVEEEIIRLQQLLVFASDQAVIRSREYGVRFYSTGYRFLKLFEDGEDSYWVDVDNKYLHARVLPEPLEIDIYIEGSPVDILNSFDDDPVLDIEEENKLATAASELDNNIAKKKLIEERKKIRPLVFLYSSSELEPEFELRIRIPGSDIEAQLEWTQGEFKRINDDE